MKNHNLPTQDTKKAFNIVESQQALNKTTTILKTNFACDADDSSDEEEVEERRNHYSFKARYEQATQKLPPYIREEKVDHACLSYTALATGIELLYSKEVNKIYYVFKERFLGGSKVKAGIDDAIDQIIEETLDKLFLIDNNQPQLKNALLDQYKVYAVETIQEIKLLLKEDVRHIIKQSRKQEIIPSLLNIADKLKHNFKEFIENLNDNILYYGHVKPFTVRNMRHDISIQNEILGENFSKVIAWLRGVGLVDNNGKTISNNKREGYPFITKLNSIDTRGSQYYQIILDKLKGIGRSVFVSNYLSRQEPTFTEAALTDLIDEELKKDYPVISRTNEQGFYQFMRRDFTESNFERLYNEAPECFVPYLPFDIGSLTQLLSKKVDDDFDILLIEAIKNNANKLMIKRKTLKSDHKFISNNFVEFLANTRLSNRSLARYIKNIRQDKTLLGPATFVHSWQFGDNKEVASEEQNITYNIKEDGYSRADMVKNLGNYIKVNEKIATTISELSKSYKNIDDSFIAKVILSALMGEKIKKINNVNDEEVILNPYVRRVIIDLVYLLFGCEVARNPGAIIANIMMLDLIIEKKLTWTEALADPAKLKQFGGGAMPMSMSKDEGEQGNNGKDKTKPESETEDKVKAKTGEPVPCARKLQEYYNPYTLLPYSYIGKPKSDKSMGKEKIQELAKREAEISRKWVEMLDKDLQATTPVKEKENSNGSWVERIRKMASKRFNDIGISL